MGCLISFPTLPTKKQLACCPPPVCCRLPPLENPGVESNSFFPLAGNLVNWKITDFRFSGSSSWTQTKKSPLQANLTGKMLCCLLYGPWQGCQWREKQETGLPPNDTLLWCESFFFFKSLNMQRLRGKALSREIQTVSDLWWFYLWFFFFFYFWRVQKR